MPDEMVVRVKWKGGYLDVSNGEVGRRRTIAFDAGDAETQAAAQAIGEAQLDLLGVTPRRSVEARIGVTPEWPENGDRIATYDLDGSFADQRLLSRRVNFDESGIASLVPVLNSPSEELIARQQRDLKKLTGGTAGGRAQGANVFQQPSNGVLTGTMSAKKLDSWSWNPIEEADGPLVTITESSVFTLVIFTIKDGPLFDALRVEYVLNDTVVAYTTIPAGRNEYKVCANLAVVPGETYGINVTNTYGNDEITLGNATLTAQLVGAQAQMDRNVDLAVKVTAEET
jgi:hypothetical protein